MGGPDGAANDRLELLGVEGYFTGESIPIQLGQSIVVGRSRRCDLSARKGRRFRKTDATEQRATLEHPDFNRISRLHLRVSYLAKDRVEIWDLSKNGTFVNGRRVDRLVLDDFGESGIEISLGRGEKLLLKRA